MAKESTMRRMNFFDGFLTTARDWNDGQEYHLEKRRLHNRLFHGVGVLPVGERLRVTGRKRGDLSLEIAPGVAIDPAGNELVLSEPVVRRVNPEVFTLPATIYVQLRYEEIATDWIEYPEHPTYKGHRRLEERCFVDLTDSPAEGVELARFQLSDDVRELRDAVDPDSPVEGEIDLRFVPCSGIAGTRFTAEEVASWRVAFRELRSHANRIVALDLATARELRVLADTLSMLHETASVTPSNLGALLTPVLEREAEMAEEAENSRPQLAARRGFAEYRRAIEAATRIATNSGLIDAGALLRLRSSANAALAAVLRDRVDSSPQPEARVTSWKELSGWSREFPEILDVEGVRLRRVDVLEVVNEDSARAHRLVIEGHRDTWRSRQSFSYPDKVEVSDAGVAFVGGQMRFQIGGLAPGRDLILIKRYDALFGEQNCDILADGKRVGSWKVSGSDRRHRWRNHHFLVPAAFISGDSVEITKRAISAERDVNVFRFWFYQPG